MRSNMTMSEQLAEAREWILRGLQHDNDVVNEQMKIIEAAKARKQIIESSQNLKRIFEKGIENGLA